MKLFEPLRFVCGVTDEQIAVTANQNKVHAAGFPRLEDAIDVGSWLCGPAELIAENLMDVQGRCPELEQISVDNSTGIPQNVILGQLDGFAKDVMSPFKSRVSTPAIAHNYTRRFHLHRAIGNQRVTLGNR